MLHPLSFLLLPPSKGGGRGRDILNLLDAKTQSQRSEDGHKQAAARFRLRCCANFYQRSFRKNIISEKIIWAGEEGGAFQLLGDNLLTNKFIKKRAPSRKTTQITPWKSRGSIGRKTENEDKRLHSFPIRDVKQRLQSDPAVSKRSKPDYRRLDNPAAAQ